MCYEGFNSMCKFRRGSSWVDFLEEEACFEYSGVDDLGYCGD